MSSRGKLFIISGPSGAGKGTLIKELLKEIPELNLTVSHTTRSPRENEIDGRDYYFINDELFDRYLRDGDFLEWAEVHGHRYGTLRSNVLDLGIDQQHNMLLEIDTRGAKQVKKLFPEAILIFIGVGDLDSLRRRLEERGTETPEEIETRMRTTIEEMKRCDNYNVMIMNDDLAEAQRKLTETVKKYLEE